MSLLPELDALIQGARAEVGTLYGQPYDVRRLGVASVSILNNMPINTIGARIERQTSRVQIEGSTFDLLVFQAKCDGSQIIVGDVLSEQGYNSDLGIYTVCEKRPTRENLWVRTELVSGVSRKPNVVARNSWEGDTRSSEQVLTLTSGVYSFSQAGATPASLPIGIQPLNRVSPMGGGQGPGVPDPFAMRRYLAYLPLLPGTDILEQDAFLTPQGRYEVLEVFKSTVGLQGYVCICEKQN